MRENYNISVDMNLNERLRFAFNLARSWTGGSELCSLYSTMNAQGANEVRRRSAPDARVRPPPPPFPLTSSEISQLLSLLVNLCISSHVSQALVAATFGRSFGSMSFHFATVVAILLFSLIDYASVTRQRRTLEALSVLQIILATLGSGVAALAAGKIENPTLAALVVHVVLSLPILGLGGGVWLQWAVSHSTYFFLRRANQACSPRY